MQLPLRVKVLQPFQQLPRDDGDVLLSKHTTLELPSPINNPISSALSRLTNQKDEKRKLTKSEHDPPEQNSMMIHRFEPLRNEPWYLHTHQNHTHQLELSSKNLFVYSLCNPS